ncbi:MAG: hypothetical protein MJE66_20295 [Proteobacteria bacterium]|nr:hypothetical protein [Pseudomonadota bacterium]
MEFVLWSNSGEEHLRGVASGTMRAASGVRLVAEVDLYGVHWQADDEALFRISVSELPLPVDSLETVESALRAWCELPLSDQRVTPLRGNYELAPGFELRCGEPADLISGQNQALLISLEVERLRVALSFTTDQSCIRDFCAGLRAACRLARSAGD